MESTIARTSKIGIIVPLWNEEKWVERTYTQLTEFLKESGIDAQLIFATDGCTDNTVEIIQALQEKDPTLIHYDHPEKLGRGLALKNAIEASNVNYILYMDSDLATKLNHIPQLIAALDEGADIVTGSRLMKGSVCVRSEKRSLFSNTYNFITRLLFQSKLRDHQCGFKGFRRKTILPLLDSIQNNGWFWDTELLVRAQKAHLKVVEFPVTWEDRDAEASKVKVWQDAKEMGSELLKLRWTISPIWIRQFVKFATVGVMNTLITILILWILQSTIGRGEYGYPLAYAVGAVNSYFWNKIFTFEQKRFSSSSTIQFIVFIVIALLGMVIYSFSASFLETDLGFFYIWASIGGTIINFIIQFLLSKFFVFANWKKSINSN